jgi:DNA-directed RNA polymerase subunit RPC12/RpoP
MAKFALRAKPEKRRIDCPYCAEAIDITSRAMSIFCPHCRERVILENFKIKTYHATRDFVTVGDVAVEKTGTLSAPARVKDMTVKGKVWGNVTARGRVYIKKTGLIKGDVVSPALVVDEGGVLVGHCRIGT